MPSTNLSGSNIFDPDLEEQTPAQDIMTEGIMQIAGGIETVVQQLQLQVVLWCLSLMPWDDRDELHVLHRGTRAATAAAAASVSILMRSHDCHELHFLRRGRRAATAAAGSALVSITVCLHDCESMLQLLRVAATATATGSSDSAFNLTCMTGGYCSGR